MQVDNSMYDKILGDLERIIVKDSNYNLKSFYIVPVIDNKNKSPILYEQLNPIEHHLGLESWCVKYLFKYASDELISIRRLLKKNKLSVFQLENLNKFLIGALLINPEVTTFWNMKKELVQLDILNVEFELFFTKLILSYKSKSSETFSYRRWLLNKLVLSTNTLNNEFEVTEIAAENADNNYHAWTHRIWCFENYFSLKCNTNRDVLMQQLDFSLIWINNHVSQHSGYHYRQYLINCVLKTDFIDNFYFKKLQNVLQVSPDENIFVSRLLGKDDCDYENSSSYVCILLYELFYTLKTLFSFYIKHESVWQHRKFVVCHLLKWIHDCYGIDFKPKLEKDVNDCNGEKNAKLFKFDTDKIESCFLYRTIVQFESKMLKESLSSSCPILQKITQKYENWLKSIVCLKHI